MKKNTNNTVRFTVDFINKKIIGTKASFDKASKGFGPIYEELAEKVANHPTFVLTVKEQKKHTTKAKRTYNGMDFDFMEAYIETRVNADQLMKEYKAVKKIPPFASGSSPSSLTSARTLCSISITRFGILILLSLFTHNLL